MLNYVLFQEDDTREESPDDLIQEFTTALPERKEEIMTLARIVS